MFLAIYQLCHACPESRQGQAGTMKELAGAKRDKQDQDNLKQGRLPVFVYPFQCSSWLVLFICNAYHVPASLCLSPSLFNYTMVANHYHSCVLISFFMLSRILARVTFVSWQLLMTKKKKSWNWFVLLILELINQSAPRLRCWSQDGTSSPHCWCCNFHWSGPLGTARDTLGQLGTEQG